LGRSRRRESNRHQGPCLYLGFLLENHVASRLSQLEEVEGVVLPALRRQAKDGASSGASRRRQSRQHLGVRHLQIWQGRWLEGNHAGLRSLTWLEVMPTAQVVRQAMRDLLLVTVDKIRERFPDVEHDKILAEVLQERHLLARGCYQDRCGEKPEPSSKEGI